VSEMTPHYSDEDYERAKAEIERLKREYEELRRHHEDNLEAMAELKKERAHLKEQLSVECDAKYRARAEAEAYQGAEAKLREILWHSIKGISPADGTAMVEKRIEVPLESMKVEATYYDGPRRWVVHALTPGDPLPQEPARFSVGGARVFVLAYHLLKAIRLARRHTKGHAGVCECEDCDFLAHLKTDGVTKDNLKRWKDESRES